LQVRHVCSPAEVLSQISSQSEGFKIVVLTVDQALDPILRLIRDVRAISEGRGFDQVGILVLSWISQPAAAFSSLEDIGIECLLRRDPDQVTDKVRTMLWRMRTRKGIPTLVIRRRNGHVVGILAMNSKAAEELPVGPRIRVLAEYLAVNSRTAHSTESLADALGICRQSVKEYLLRLRKAFDMVRTQLGISTPGRNAFWTERRPGGYVHGVRANIRFDDLNPSESSTRD